MYHDESAKPTLISRYFFGDFPITQLGENPFITIEGHDDHLVQLFLQYKIPTFTRSRWDSGKLDVGIGICHFSHIINILYVHRWL
jgi:hypothetical protein